MDQFEALLTRWSNELRALLEPRLQSFSFTAYLIVFAAGVLTSFTPWAFIP